MKTIYFISDIHLGSQDILKEVQKENFFLEFLETMPQKGDTLFILGDLFDFWFEYKHVIPKGYLSILSALHDITKNGTTVHYVCGNHDFWVGKYFEDELGIQVHRDPFIYPFQNKKYYISHGDGLAKMDSGYRFLKRILRNPVNIFLYRLIHPDLGIPFAKYCSHFSRTYKSIKDNDQEYIDFAEEKSKEDIQGIILGHTHRPLEIHKPLFSLLNVGDWMNHFSYGKLQNSKLSLHYWGKNKRER